MRVVLRVVPVLLLVLSLALPATAQVTEPKTGRTFPESIGYPGREGAVLRCAGVGVRTKAVFKVYAAALYLDEAGARGELAGRAAQASGEPKSPDSLCASIIASDRSAGGNREESTLAKAIVMKFVRGVGKDKVRETYLEMLERTLGPLAASPVRENAEAFLAMFTEDVADGDEIELYGCGARVGVLVKGVEKGALSDGALAEAIWSIWLGEKPVSDDLRRGLISRTGWIAE